MQAEALIFDCDGVLIDSEVIFLAEERNFLGELGLDYDAQTYVQRFMGLNNDDWIRALTADYLAAGLGQFPSDFLERKRARTWPRIQAELQAIPGARDLIDGFQGGVATASSSSADRLVIKLEIAGLWDALQPHIYSTDLVEHGKPAPDLFLLAAEKLGVMPANCVVIEDSVNGVKAGVAANMQVIGFTGGSHADAGLVQRLSEAGAAYVFDSHAKISTFLDL